MSIKLFLFFILSILINMPCPYIEIEDLIGNNIAEIPCSYESLDINGFDVNAFSIEGEESYLFNRPFINLIAITDNELNINKIVTDFRGSLDIDFYNLLKDKYGEPDKILRKDKEIIRNEEINDGIESIETKSSLVECDFEDNPILLVWIEPKYMLTFTIIRDLNKTELVVTKS